MAWRIYIMLPLVSACLAAPSQAGIFSRKPKPNPADQVGDMVRTLHTDTDERHRAAAADDLGKLDAKIYPAVQPALIETLMKDPSSAVRHEAAQALGKVRPLSSQAAYALEHALNNDISTRVRMTARTALWQYHLAGYRGGNGPPAGPQTNEPPIAAAPKTAAPQVKPAPVATARNQPAPVRKNGVRETNEPPLASATPPSTSLRVNPPAARLAPPPVKIDIAAEPPLAIMPAPRPPLPVEKTPELPKAEVKPTPLKLVPSPKPAEKKEDDGPVLNPPG